MTDTLECGDDKLGAAVRGGIVLKAEARIGQRNALLRQDRDLIVCLKLVTRVKITADCFLLLRIRDAVRLDLRKNSASGIDGVLRGHNLVSLRRFLDQRKLRRKDVPVLCCGGSPNNAALLV